MSGNVRLRLPPSSSVAGQDAASPTHASGLSARSRRTFPNQNCERQRLLGTLLRCVLEHLEPPQMGGAEPN
jgi:hypothetical protein